MQKLRDGSNFWQRISLRPQSWPVKSRYTTSTERWQSGRMRRSRKPLSVNADPGFESLSLRQMASFNLFFIYKVKEPTMEPKLEPI